MLFSHDSLRRLNSDAYDNWTTGRRDGISVWQQDSTTTRKDADRIRPRKTDLVV